MLSSGPEYLWSGWVCVIISYVNVENLWTRAAKWATNPMNLDVRSPFKPPDQTHTHTTLTQYSSPFPPFTGPWLIFGPNNNGRSLEISWSCNKGRTLKRGRGRCKRIPDQYTGPRQLGWRNNANKVPNKHMIKISQHYVVRSRCYPFPLQWPPGVCTSKQSVPAMRFRRVLSCLIV